MKNYIFTLIMFMFLFSCSNNNEVNENTSNTTSNDTVVIDDKDVKDSIPQGNSNAPEMAIELVKFTDNKYREYILAEYITDSVTMRGTPLVAEELIVGTIPYSVELPNGYWAIDWRWGMNFIYPPSNILLPYLWSSLKHWNDKWEKPQEPMNFKDYIEEVRFASRRSIDEQYDIFINNDDWEKTKELYYPHMFVIRGYTSTSEIAENDKADYYYNIHKQDSLHSVYLEKLVEIINQGSFDKVTTVAF